MCIEEVIYIKFLDNRSLIKSTAACLLETLTTLAAVATKTSTIGLGTSIVPTYPRHSLVLAQQALSLSDIAPNRLRLRIGPSRQAIMSLV